MKTFVLVNAKQQYVVTGLELTADINLASVFDELELDKAIVEGFVAKEVQVFRTIVPIAVESLEIVEHITARNKVIRGVIRKDVTAAQAKAIDPYTFPKDGGYFIREKYLAA